MTDFTAFSAPQSFEMPDDAGSLLTIESDEDRLVLSGSLEIPADRTGLERLTRIVDLLAAARDRLASLDPPDVLPPL